MNEITTLAVNGQEYTLTDAGAVAFDKVQTLTDDQQLQARLNIDAASATDVENEIDRLDAAIAGLGAGGGLNITDDGIGNVAIVATGSVSITDDGAGNVTIA